ncbi:MAG: hypothetical protein LUC88_03020 [Prevotella sp.]|nr:hypothetical protein [Prevotella sp.]
MKSRIKRHWSFSGMATTIRIALLSYYNIYSVLNHPEKDWETLIKNMADPDDRQLYLFE